MSALNSCSSWKELKRPQHPFFGAMFSRSHRKRKRKRVLQPIDNPGERGRSLENHKSSAEISGLRSISVENSAILKANHEILHNLLLDPSSQLLISTDSSLEFKLPPKPAKNPPQKNEEAKISDNLMYLEVDKAMNNTISMRKKYVKPLHPDKPKPVQSFSRGRKYVKSPRKTDYLPFAPDLKPVGINAFNLQINRLEIEVSQFFDSVSKNKCISIEELLRNSNCKALIA